MFDFFDKKFTRETYFLKPIFSTKKFASNCSPHIAKNPRGHWGRGFRGGVGGGYVPGTMPVLRGFLPWRTEYRRPRAPLRRVSVRQTP